MDQIKQELITPGKKNITFKIENREDGEAYESQTNKDSKFGLVLIQEWWGLNVSITKATDQFASEGFRVVCPDIYRGKCAKDREQAGHLKSGLDWQGAVADIAGNVKYLKSNGCTKVGVLGFCMGGALTIAALTQCSEIDAGAPFYGVPDLKEWDVSKITVPVFSQFAENDKAKGFSDIETAKIFEAECLNKGVKLTQKIWQNVEHAFMNQDSANYNKETAEIARKEVCQFFKSVFSI